MYMKLHEAWLSLPLSIPISVPACTHPSVWSASHTNDRKPVYQQPPSDIRPNHHLAITFASSAKHVSDGWQLSVFSSTYCYHFLGNVQVWRHQEVPPTGLGKYDTWWCQCWDRGGWSSKIWCDDGILWQCFTSTSWNSQNIFKQVFWLSHTAHFLYTSSVAKIYWDDWFQPKQKYIQWSLKFLGLIVH